jgi:PBP1b-binding outer membrane lipoprotein LpoB
MHKYLLLILFGIIILSGCSLNEGISSNQDKVTKKQDSQIGTENSKQDIGKSGDEIQASLNPKEPYNSETAIENGDIVNIHGNISNLDKFGNFIKNVESGSKDKIRITMYTVEGDPIFYNLNYDGNQIQYTFDNSLDGFRGSENGISSASCSGIGTQN